MAPFHIQAQILRQVQLAPATALDVFAPLSEEDAEPSSETRTRKSGWRQSDVRRAIAAAEQAELQAYRVEIAPDGTISIVVGMPTEMMAEPAEDRASLTR